MAAVSLCLEPNNNVYYSVIQYCIAVEGTAHLNKVSDERLTTF